MKIRLTVEFTVEENDKYKAAAAIEGAVKEVGECVAGLAEVDSHKVSFPTGPKKKAK